MRDKDKAGRLTPIPLDTPVITYTDILSDSNLKWVRIGASKTVWNASC